MGDFLSVPNKDKESEDNENNDVIMNKINSSFTVFFPILIHMFF